MRARRTFHVLSFMLVLSLLIVPAEAAQAGRGEAARGNASSSADPLTNNGSLYWNTFLGGSDVDSANGIVLDGSGNLYVTGGSWAGWGTPIDPHSGGWGDAFVAKLSPDGALLWHTLLGGDNLDSGMAISLDGAGNIFVAGGSFASWGTPVSPFMGGVSDAFVARLDSNGSLIWNTFLGGNGYDVSQDM